MDGGLSYQVADPPFATAGSLLPRARAPPEPPDKPRTRRRASGSTRQPWRTKTRHPTEITDRSQGMTHLTSTCAQRNRLIRPDRKTAHGGSTGEMQQDDSAEADP